MKNKKICGVLIGLVSVAMVGCGNTLTQTSTTEIENQAVETQVKTTESEITTVQGSTKDNIEDNAVYKPEFVESKDKVDYHLIIDDKTDTQIGLINSCIEKMNTMTKQERYRMFIDDVVHEASMYDLYAEEPKEFDTTDETKVISYLLHMEFMFTERNIEYSNKTPEQLATINKILNEYIFTSMKERSDKFSFEMATWQSDYETKARACMIAVEILSNTTFEGVMKNDYTNKPWNEQTDEERQAASDVSIEEATNEMEELNNMTDEEINSRISQNNAIMTGVSGYTMDDGTVKTVRMTGNNELKDSFNNFIDLDGNIVDTPYVLDKSRLCGISL